MSSASNKKVEKKHFHNSQKSKACTPKSNFQNKIVFYDSFLIKLQETEVNGAIMNKKAPQNILSQEWAESLGAPVIRLTYIYRKRNDISIIKN
ncbi:hypothetical protein HZS_1975 [Henneguya salminicola]|nr:hypothetical protein HZS_1975 [Henneguya salminicola]